jgi:hypothetical protein
MLVLLSIMISMLLRIFALDLSECLHPINRARRDSNLFIQNISVVSSKEPYYYLNITSLCDNAVAVQPCQNHIIQSTGYAS